MNITTDDVAYIAHLARLKLDEKSLPKMARDLENILSYVEQLKEVDTSRTDPTAHVLSLHNVLRADTNTPSLDRDDILKIAPQASQDGFYLVPKIIE